MILSRDAILQADDLKKEKVEVPEWGGAVFVTTLTGSARELLEAEMYSDKPDKNVRALFCALSIVDEQGEPLFTKADVGRLSKKNWRALDRVFDKARELNAIGAGELEELEKN